MSANVQQYFGRQSAWHKLGKVIGRFFSIDDLNRETNILFTPVKHQLQFQGKDVPAWGLFNEETGQFITPTTETYEVLPHARGFHFMNSLVGADSQHAAYFETAGVLGNGEVVFGLLNLNAATHIGNDRIENYLAYATSYNQSIPDTWFHTDTRIVCQNTLNIALSQKTKAQFRIKHTKKAGEKLVQAERALASVRGDIQNVGERLTFLANRMVKREHMENILDRLFPKNDKAENQTRRGNILKQVLENYEFNDNNAFPEQRGTAFNALNAVTEFADHQRGGDTKRAQSATFGTGDSLKTRALEVITKEAESMPERVLIRRDGTQEIESPSQVAVAEKRDTSLLDDILNGDNLG